MSDQVNLYGAGWDQPAADPAADLVHAWQSAFYPFDPDWIADLVRRG